MQGLVGSGEDMGFYLEGGGGPGGLWAEEGWELTQVLTGTLLLLWGGQIVGSKGRSWGTKAEVTVLVQVGTNGGWTGWEGHLERDEETQEKFRRET